MSNRDSVERWSPVKSWEGFYEVSDKGQVRSLDRVVTYCTGVQRKHKGKILRQKEHTRGYGHKQVTLECQNRKETSCVHSLVLEAFVGPPPPGFEACHKDSDPSNNCVENLYWGSRTQNRRDRMVAEHGSDLECPRGHLLITENLVQSKLPGRCCLACDRAGSRCSYFHRKHGVELDMQIESDRAFEKIVNG